MIKAYLKSDHFKTIYDINFNLSNQRKQKPFHLNLSWDLNTCIMRNCCNKHVINPWFSIGNPLDKLLSEAGQRNLTAPALRQPSAFT